MIDSDSELLVARWQSGDENAAALLFDRYSARLIALVRLHRREKFAARFDAEDVVQSAFRSFFRRTREGQFCLDRGGDLWRLLVAISLHKLQHQVRRHTAVKRSVQQEENVPELGNSLRVTPSATPSPHDGVALADIIDSIAGRLTDVESRVFNLRLESYTLDEIAKQTQRSQRSVRRILERIKRLLRREYPQVFSDEPTATE